MTPLPLCSPKRVETEGLELEPSVSRGFLGRRNSTVNPFKLPWDDNVTIWLLNKTEEAQGNSCFLHDLEYFRARLLKGLLAAEDYLGALDILQSAKNTVQNDLAKLQSLKHVGR